RDRSGDPRRDRWIGDRVSAEPETTTYRGESLEELLPQIREELGPDAIIVRQREGIVGGVGGFFGQKGIGVEARAAEPMQPHVSPRAAANACHTGDAPAPREPLLEVLMSQTSPFVEQLEEALAREPEPVVAPPPPPPPVFEMPTRPAPTPV